MISCHLFALARHNRSGACPLLLQFLTYLVRSSENAVSAGIACVDEWAPMEKRGTEALHPEGVARVFGRHRSSAIGCTALAAGQAVVVAGSVQVVGVSTPSLASL